MRLITGLYGTIINFISCDGLILIKSITQSMESWSYTYVAMLAAVPVLRLETR